MKLLYTLTSPYARKVRIVALEKHIDLELQEVVLADPDCPVKNYNPLGKVPVLVLDDNDSVYDSKVIVEYLDNRAPGTHLFFGGRSRATRARHRAAVVSSRGRGCARPPLRGLATRGAPG